MIRLIVLALLATLGTAQNIPNRFSATTGDTVLAGAGTKFTIQALSTGKKLVTLEAAVIYCSVACDVSQIQNGTAATATAGTVLPIQPVGPTGTATVWTASNVGSGSNVGGVLHALASIPVVLDLSKISFSKTSSSATNYTIVVAPITGTANIALYWSEQ